MAWQLIYTSAPRSLEAGRSGFGTVARHRAISPLLVSAIERASQFSRLAGVDTGRVIFSYRIITVAGGRFHVLSSIRDAGADYTGRTNHIAHHLIADPREIAQLGPNGPSPADVLLAMQWATSWTEQPRFLDTVDEVALATIPPQTNGSAWQRIAGSPAQAWLLASGEASRGAYVIQPSGTDLRAIFAESLRLVPERLWQIPFTTSLQPSDEPADFRWIGIEERSPLRTQTESSGRPVLNLAAPSTLPLVEVVQPTAPSPVRQNFGQVPAPAPAEGRTASPESTPVSVPPQQIDTSRERTAGPPRAPSFSQRTEPKWWLLAGAVTVAVAGIAAMVILFLIPRSKQAEARSLVEKRLQVGDYFTTEMCHQMALKMVTSPDASRGLKIADAVNRLIGTLHKANLTELQSEETNADLAILANLDGQGLPEELGRLREIVVSAQRLSNTPQDLDGAKNCDDLAQIVMRWLREISSLKPVTPLPKLIKELSANAERKQADILLKMLNGPYGPIERGGFEHKVDEFKAKTSDPDALKTIALVKRLMGEQVMQAASSKPEGVHKTLTSALTIKNITPPENVEPHPSATITTAIAQSSDVPIYFADGLKDLNTLTIKELKKGLSYHLDPGIKGNLEPLFEDEASGKLHRKSGVTDPIFEIQGTRINAMEKAPQMPELPFALIARQTPDNDIVQIWIVAKSTMPILATRTVVMRRTGNTLNIDARALGIPGIIKSPLRLGLPEDCTIPGKTQALPVDDKWNVDLESVIEEIGEVKTRLAAEIEGLIKATTNPTQQAFRTQKEKLIQVTGLSDELKKPNSEMSKALVSESSPEFQQAGGYIVAATIKANFPKSEDLFKAGQTLKKMDAKANVKAQNDTLEKALESTQAARKQLKDNVDEAELRRQRATTNEQKRPIEAELNRLKGDKISYTPIINAIEDLINAVLPEKPRARQLRESRESGLREQLITKQADLSKLSNNPLISHKASVGHYQLFVRVGGKDLLLSEFEGTQ